MAVNKSHLDESLLISERGGWKSVDLNPETLFQMTKPDNTLYSVRQTEVRGRGSDVQQQIIPTYAVSEVVISGRGFSLPFFPAPVPCCLLLVAPFLCAVRACAVYCAAICLFVWFVTSLPHGRSFVPRQAGKTWYRKKKKMICSQLTCLVK